MRTAVLDASALVRCVLSPSGLTRVLEVAADATWRAPEFSLTECANVLWKHAVFGDLPAWAASDRLAALASLDIDLQESAPLLPAALEIAMTLRHPVYDCLYVALAMADDADLVTCDRRLAQAARDAGLGDRVTLIEV